MVGQVLAPVALGGLLASVFGSLVGAGGALIGGAASVLGGAAHLGAAALGRGGKKAARGGGPIPFQGGAAGGPTAGKATPRPAPAATTGAKPSGMIVTQVDPTEEGSTSLILIDIRRILNAMYGDIAIMKAQSTKKPFEEATASLANKDAADAKRSRAGLLGAVKGLMPKTTAGKALGATALLALLPVIAGMMSQMAKDQTENLARLLPRWLQRLGGIGEFSPEGQQEQLELLNNTLKDLRAQKENLPTAAQGAILTPQEQSIVDRARARKGLLDDIFSSEEQELWFSAREKIAEGLGKMTTEENKLNIAIERQIGETLRNIRKVESRIEDYKEEGLLDDEEEKLTSAQKIRQALGAAKAEVEGKTPLGFFDPYEKDRAMADVDIPWTEKEIRQAKDAGRAGWHHRGRRPPPTWAQMQGGETKFPEGEAIPPVWVDRSPWLNPDITFTGNEFANVSKENFPFVPRPPINLVGKSILEQEVPPGVPNLGQGREVYGPAWGETGAWGASDPRRASIPRWGSPSQLKMGTSSAGTMVPAREFEGVSHVYDPLQGPAAQISKLIEQGAADKADQIAVEARGAISKPFGTVFAPRVDNSTTTLTNGQSSNQQLPAIRDITQQTSSSSMNDGLRQSSFWLGGG